MATASSSSTTRSLRVVKNWQSIVRADDAEQFATFKKRIEQFVDFRKELVRRASRDWLRRGPRMGRQRRQSRRPYPPSTRISKRCPRSMPSAASGSPEQGDVNRNLALLLTCLGGHGAGAGRHRGPHHRPLGRAAAFGHHHHHQAGRRGRRGCRGSAYRSRRRNRRAGARDPDLPGGDGPQPQPQFAGVAGLQGARRTGRHIEASVDEFRARSEPCSARSPTMRRRCATPRNPSPG